MITKHFINLNQHAMKNLTLKVAVVALAMFAGFGASAQPWTATSGNYTAGTDTTGGVAGMTAGSYFTVNKPMPFWVWPSVAYNPDYVGAGALSPNGFNIVANITANVVSPFAWTATDLTPAATGNYVELTWLTPGDKIITVRETPIGVCSGVPTQYKVLAVGVPTIKLATGATVKTIPNVVASGCEGDPALANYVVGITFPTANETYPYNLAMTYKVYTVDALSITGDINPADFTAVATPTFSAITGKFGAANAGTVNNPVEIAAGTTLVASHTYATEAVASVPKITIYEFDVTGWNGLISRKSDYVAFRTADIDMNPLTIGPAGNVDNFTYYNTPVAGDATKNYIIVYPKPVTGPIYHIANSFGV